MNPNETLNARLAGFFERVAISGPERAESEGVALGKELQRWAELSLKSISQSNINLFWGARPRIAGVEGLPPAVTAAFQRVESVVMDVLICPNTVKTHWQRILGNSGRCKTKLSEWMRLLEHMKMPTSQFILSQVLTPDSLQRNAEDLRGEILAACSPRVVVGYLQALVRCTDGSGLYLSRVVAALSEFWDLAPAEPKKDEHGKVVVTFDEVESIIERVQKKLHRLKEGEHLFVPTGWESGDSLPALFIALQITRTDDDSYRLRFLSREQNDMHHLGKDVFHRDPAVMWSNLSRDLITKSELWQALIEPLVAPSVVGRDCKAYGSKQLLATIKSLLGRNVDSIADPAVDAVAKTFDFAKEEDWGFNDQFIAMVRDGVPKEHRLCVWKESIQPQGPLPKHLQCAAIQCIRENTERKGPYGTPFYAKKSGLPEMKKARLETGSGVVDVITMAVLEEKDAYKLAKVELWLLMCTHLLQSLQKGYIPLEQRQACLAIAKKIEEKKLPEALSKLAERVTTEEHREALEALVATFLDWQVRMKHLVRTFGAMELVPLKSLYPMPTLPHSVAAPLEVERLLGAAGGDGTSLSRMEQGIAHSTLPMPHLKFPLDEETVDNIVAAVKERRALSELRRRQLRSHEWLLWMHSHFVEPLPLPTAELPWTFAAGVSAEKIRDLMEIVHAAGESLLYQCYEDKQILPWVVADIAHLYRVQIELLSQLVPEAADCDVSWVHFSRLLHHRGFDRLTTDLDRRFRALEASFLARSYWGNQPAPAGDEKVVPLFDHTWTSLPASEYGPKRFHDLRVLEKLCADPNNPGFGSSYSQNVHRMHRWIADKLGIPLADVEYYSSATVSPGVDAYMLAKQSAQLLEMACTTQLKVSKLKYEFQLLHFGPQDHMTMQLFHLAFQKNCAFPHEQRGGDTEGTREVKNLRIAPTHKVSEPAATSKYSKGMEALKPRFVSATSPQAVVVKQLSLTARVQKTYDMLMAAVGSQHLNVDYLFEHFETRSRDLLEADAQQWFLAVLHMSEIFRTSVKNEPAVAQRLSTLLMRCIEEDAQQMDLSFHRARLLWVAEVCYFSTDLIGKAGPFDAVVERCAELLPQLMKSDSPSESSRAAMLFLLAQNPSCDSQNIDLHTVKAAFLFGRCQSKEPRYAHLRLLAAMAVQKLAPAMAQAMALPERRGALLTAVLGESYGQRWDGAGVVDTSAQQRELHAVLHSYVELQERRDWLKRKRDYLLRWYGKKDRGSSWQNHGLLKLLTETETEISDAEDHLEVCRRHIHEETASKGVYHCYPLTILQDGEETIEIDWETSTICRNGYVDIVGMLPPEAQQSIELEPLGALRKESMHCDTTRARYSPLNKEYGALSFTTYPHRAFLDFEGAEYQLLTRKEASALSLPEALQEGFTLWRRHREEKDADRALLICAHHDNGAPIPAYTVDMNGQVRPLDSKTPLFLADDTMPCPESAPFTRLGFRTEHLLVWVDDKQQPRRVDIPMSFEGERFLSFEKTVGGQWQLRDHRHILQAQKSVSAALLGEPMGLLVRDGEHQYMLLSQIEMRTWQQRYYQGTAVPEWKDIWASRCSESAALIAFDPIQGLHASTHAQNLYLAALSTFVADFPKAASLLRRWAQPVGRAYTPEELRYLSWIVQPPKGQEDMHVDAAVVRLLTLQHMHHHLQEYPVDVKVLPEELQEFVKLWRKRQRKPSEKTVSRNEKIDRDFEAILTGQRSDVRCRLNELLTPYEQEEIVRMLLLYHEQAGPWAQIALCDRLTPGGFDFKVSPPCWDAKLVENEYRKVHQHIDDKDLIGRAFQEILQGEQVETIPFTKLRFLTVPHSPYPLFRRAYELLTTGGDGAEEEYDGLCAYLDAWQETEKTFTVDYEALGYDQTLRPDVAYKAYWQLLRAVRKCVANHPTATWPAFPAVERSPYGGSEYDKDTKRIFETFVHELLKTLKCKSFVGLLEAYGADMVEARAQMVVGQKRAIPGHTWANDKIEVDIPYTLKPVLEQWRHIKESDSPAEATPLLLGDAAVELDSVAYAPSSTPDGEFLRELGSHIDRVENKARALEKLLLACVNALPEGRGRQMSEALQQMGPRRAATVDECIGLALDGSRERWEARCPYADSAQAQNLVGRYLYLKTEEQHLRRLGEQLARAVKEDASFDDKQKAAQMRRAMRVYEPTAANLILMVHEYYAGQRLRPEQNDLIDLMTTCQNEPHFTGRVIQLIMGAGKSKVLAPILALLNARRGQISMYVVPNALFGTGAADFVQMLYERFGRKVDVLTFDRELCDREGLIRLAAKLRAAQEEGIILVTRPRDLHALQLMLKERHELIRQGRERLRGQIFAWTMAQTDGDKSRSEDLTLQLMEGRLFQSALSKMGINEHWVQRWKTAVRDLCNNEKAYRAEMDLLQPILRVLEIKGHTLCDEWASEYDPRTQLSFPVGPEEPVNPAAVRGACKLYFDDLPRYESDIGIEQGTQHYTKQETVQRIRTQVAANAWDTYARDLEGAVSEKVFMAYLLSDSENHYDSQVEFYSKLLVWNGETNVIRRAIGQDLGFLKDALSQMKDIFAARAFVNYTRSEQLPSQVFTIPAENGVPKEGTLYKGPNETLLKSCQYHRKVWNRSTETKELLQVALAEVRRDKSSPLGADIIALFERNISLEGLRDGEVLEQFTARIQNTLTGEDENRKRAAQRLVSFYLATKLQAQVKLDPRQLKNTPCDLGRFVGRTDGFGGTWSFARTWPGNVEQHPNAQIGPQIEEVLRGPANQKVSAVDTGSCGHIVKRIRQLGDDNMSAVIDVGAQFPGDSNEQVARALLAAFPERKGVLFYQSGDGVSTLALLTDKGVETLPGSDKEQIARILHDKGITRPITYYDQAHTIGADVDQPPGSYAFVLISNKVTWDDLQQAVMRMRGLIRGTHSLHFLIPQRMEGTWTTDKVIDATKAYQIEREAPVNFHGICDQLRGTLRKHMDRAMNACTDHEERQKLHDRWESYLVEEHGNDLLLAHGAPRKRLLGWKALIQAADEIPVDLLGDGADDVRKELDSILAWHKENETVIPEQVWGGEECSGATKEVSLHKNLMNEEENERMLASRVVKEEVPWKALDKSRVVASSFGMAGDETMPALYSLNKALQDRKVAAVFDDDILISENLLTTFKGQNNNLVTADQKPIHHVLVVKKEGEWTVALISEGDAEGLKTYLIGNPVAGCWIMEPNGALSKAGVNKKKWVTPFLSSKARPKLCHKLAQCAWLQGDVMHMVDSEFGMLDAVKQWLVESKELYKQKVELLEHVIAFRTDDAAHYREHRDQLLLDISGNG
ncbi:MAG: hypothetical protein K940chlam7_00101 [Chlamydiae bacterium]|nr:hypothetical protein [Chlamydiota bacterium]